MLDLRIDYTKAVNFALTNNGIELCQSASLQSSDADLHNVYVECSGEYFTTTRTPLLPVLPKGKLIKLADFTIKPDNTQMAQLTERVKTAFTVKVYCDADTQDAKREVLSQDYDIELMAYDQWLGTGILPQSLACFVTPNHPLVNGIIVKAAKYMKELTGESAFTEYQSGSPTEVARQVAAVFAALHDENIIYKALPASFETVGQRITMPDQVLTTKLGNCIELTLLFASILESIGINTGVVMHTGHAYLAVWLVDDCCRYSVCDDVSYVEKKCSDGIAEMLVLESTMVSRENASFDDALQAANLKLADLDAFHMMIDIKRCRLENYRPMPQRVLVDGKWVVEQPDGVEHDNTMLDVREHSRYDLSQIGDHERELGRMDIWERKLLDFSLRNTMLNLKLSQKAIQFISFDIDKLEDNLQDGVEYRIVERPDVEIELDKSEKLYRSKLYPALQGLVSNDIQHHRLHSYYPEGTTKEALKNIYRAARNMVEETGANSLYLTIGTLRWFETDRSATARYAPILMLPVEMVYKKGAYFIRTTDADIMLNVTLFEFLRQNYGIDIPGINPLPTDGHGVDVRLIFTIIRDALKEQKMWDVEEESVLGVFSFSKFLMWNDIHNHRKEMLESKVIESLVEQRLTWKPDEMAATLREDDKTLSPDKLALPVPVDSSQMAAVMEAGKGHSFILYGPPGTGKSQTITNLIANALFQGKRVLFVAEKMAALSVVQSRLAKIGLDPFCLEMHSNKVTKRHILEQLDKALKVAHIMTPEEYALTAEKLYAERTKLIAYMEALHENKGSDGFSLYDCILRYEDNSMQPLQCDVLTDTLMAGLNRQAIADYEHLLGDRLEAVLKLIGQPSKNPLLGLNINESDLASEKQLRDNLQTAITILNNGISERSSLAGAKDLRERLLRDANEGIFSADVEALYQEWRQARAKWFVPRFFAKRSFMEKMRQYCAYITEADVDKLLGDVMTYNKLHAAIQKIQKTVSDYFNETYDADILPSTETMQQMVGKLSTWSDSLGGARDWYHWCQFRSELIGKGFAPIVNIMETQEINPKDVQPMTMKAIFLALAKRKISESAVLRTFEGMIFDDTVALYKKLTTEFQMLSQKELYAKLASQIPHVTDNVDSSSEIGLLNRNISNGGRGTSLRDLMSQIPTLMPRLCPCMLMSPMSVAQYLALDNDKFDIVIFDEASQMPTPEAVGAIARGKALVVVGDPKQMPPTSFFTTSNVDEDEADIDDMESILEDCKTLEIPSLQLNWHYRSQHESLIAFSNNEYYDGELITFPSVDDKQTKVGFVAINGVYDKGGRRSNKAEAEAIVKEIERRLTDKELCGHSIGVIAFSVVQQNLIEDMLQEKMDKNKALFEAAEQMYEPIFIKNLENVQGDERDVILFSIGYGPDKSGKVSMNFGPLNNKGGERRLNVAVSRARQEMIVFSTMHASDIDLRRSNAKGVEGLKHFLEYAERQVLMQSENTVTSNSDVIIAEQIASELNKRGYMTSVNVGRSQFKVDVAVSSKDNPDVYQLGILLDGEGYHNTITTRDREIVQPSVLGNLKWQVMRVWSVDWFNNPQRVINRIIERLESMPEETKAQPSAQKFDISNETVIEAESHAEDYKEFKCDAKVAVKMDDMELAKAILMTEQPMTLMQLCRRACALRGIPRVTPTIIRDFTEIVQNAFFVEPDRDGSVVWTDEKVSREYTSYRTNNGRDITDIPMAEIKNAVTEAVREQFSIGIDALSLITAKKLGFTRRGSNLESALHTAVEQLCTKHILEETNGNIHMK